MFKFLKSYLFSFIIFIIMFFSLGFFICEYCYNSLQARYVYVFESESDNLEYLLDVDFFEQSIAILDENNISHADINYENMLKTSKLEYSNGYYHFSVRKSFFPNTLKQSNGLVNEAEARFIKYIGLVFSNALDDISYVKVELLNYQNPFIIGGLSSLFGLVLLLIIFVIAYIKEKKIKVIANNETIFSHPFNKKYWNLSKGFFDKVKNISLISVLFAFMMICKLIPIPSGFGNLGLGITYLVFAVITLIYGPICGILIGAMSDILGFFLFQGGSIFFPGYTLDAMLAGFIYGICFYRTKITFTKCLMARIIVNLLINVCLGTLWWSIIYKLNIEQSMTYLLVTSLPKNLIYLLPQSILLFIVVKALSKPLFRFGLIEEEIVDNISLI